MLKSHEKFHSTNGKRLILVADDEQINRELLGMVLEAEYEVVFAADGVETMEQVRKYKDDLSLVLLDLMMPRKSGMEVLQEMRSTPELQHIPVIVLTADQNAEVQSLSIGAIDYIPKPYPQAEIILARILRAIELSEDRDIIQSTERDPLTGLYNREYFYRYAEQFDQHHRDLEMDAIVVDINHFHMINERFGSAYGDEVLRRIGEKIRDSVSDTGGIVCRREADTFMAYCPHGKDYQEILNDASIALTDDESVNSRVRLRMGVYACVDRSMDVERRFDRAKMAADTVRNSFTRTVGIYDETMHEREIYAVQLVDDFHLAIEEKQFRVFYQPKFDIRPKVPVLSSAEALVRWVHPKLGMISPGVFIPLFEENGLIQELDRFVWTETARQIRAWKEEFGFSVPVSVNVSRIDMYDPDLLQRFQGLLQEFDLSPDEILLEITESAYTQDSDQIIETVNALRQLGFRIEMDDFGTGYSSLNMISTLPIDALKLDMQFVRNAFKEQKDTRLLEVIIDIADHLAVPVIAEGVETADQLFALRELGCDIAQGYHFSRPVPADEFSPFIMERAGLEPEALLPETPEQAAEEKLVELSEDRPEEKTIMLRTVNIVFSVLAFILAVLLFISDSMITRSHVSMDEANRHYILSEQASSDLEAGSDYLTVSVRSFAVTGELRYLEDYFEEVLVTRRRDNAVADLKELLQDENSVAYTALSKGLEYSNELMELEYRAMRLTQLGCGIPDGDVPAEVAGYKLSPEDEALSPVAKREAAVQLLFGGEYLLFKDQIREQVQLCSDELVTASEEEMAATRAEMDRLMQVQGALLIAMVLAVAGEVVYLATQVRGPLTRMVEHMRTQEAIPPAGAEELRFVARTYNEILGEISKKQKILSYEATHDPLTGLGNRSYYESFMENADRENIALMIIDVDHFKSINDTYGHDVGDRILKKVAEILTRSFRSVDAVCRHGGDELVAVMTRANSTMEQLVLNKISRANALLQEPEEGLPKTSLSVGVAFSDRKDPEGDIFKDADTALYRVKNSGRSGCAIYGSEHIALEK